MGSKSITKRELVLKSIIYRVWTICWEAVLALFLTLLNMQNLFIFIAVVNLIKVAIYFIYDLGWFSLSKRPLIKAVKRWLGVEG